MLAVNRGIPCTAGSSPWAAIRIGRAYRARAQADKIPAANMLAIAAQRGVADPALPVVPPLLEPVVFHVGVPPLSPLYRLCTGKQDPPVLRRNAHFFLGYAPLQAAQSLVDAIAFGIGPARHSLCLFLPCLPSPVADPSSRIFSSLPRAVPVSQHVPAGEAHPICSSHLRVKFFSTSRTFSYRKHVFSSFLVVGYVPGCAFVSRFLRGAPLRPFFFSLFLSCCAPALCRFLRGPSSD